MAYLRITKRNTGRQYYYVCTSVRRGGRVVTKVLEYLGANPSPDRLAAARKYWGITTRRKKK